jgi:uncharacterized protein (TIGR03545 family)
MTAPTAPPRWRIFRWKGIGPLLLFLVLLGILYWLFTDTLVRRSVEKTGTAFVGARVELDEADVRLTEGVVMLRGLRVTNPRKPMTNLFQADQIVVNVRMAPLLEKKVIIDTVAVRGLAFGTARETSGAIERAEGPAGEVGAAVDRWVESLPLPALSWEGLGQAVDVGAVSAESLATLREARALVGGADSARRLWLDRIQGLDPRPQIDSAEALAGRLEGQSVRSLGLAGARDAAESARRTIAALAQLDNQLAALQAGVDSGVRRARGGLTALADARQQDYAYALGLLKLPSLDAPSLGPALFGRFAAQQVAPVLYWLGLAERYMPPGVEARLRQGPDRVRAAGTNVLFPKHEHLPAFLLQVAEASLAIGGTGAAAGEYAARLTDLTSAPALVGRPTVLQAGRTAGQRGPETVRLGAILNRVGEVARDSVGAFVSGVGLPTVALAPLGAELGLGRGTTELVLQRRGDSLDARLGWHSTGVAWRRLGADSAAAPDSLRPSAIPERITAAGVGQSVRRSATDIAWRTLSGLTDVRIDARLTGSLRSPRLAVGSNVAGALADGLRNELGAEVRRAEGEVRARVDALVQERVTEAQQAVAGFEAQARERIAAERARLEQARRDLEARIRALTGIPGIGGGVDAGKGTVGDGRGR